MKFLSMVQLRETQVFVTLPCLSTCIWIAIAIVAGRAKVLSSRISTANCKE